MTFQNPLHFVVHLLAQPGWLIAWIGWMIVINTASAFFLPHRAARWTLLAWIANLVIMPLLFAINGYNRLLGLSHILCWTPLLIRLRTELPKVPRGTPFGTWLRLLFTTNLISWIIDLVDVGRYLSGDQ